MKFLIADDEAVSLRKLGRILQNLYPKSEIISAEDAFQALQYFDNQVDVAFLDIEMPELDGITLAKKLCERKANLNIIFITAYSDYVLDAFRMHASGYITKPYSQDDIIKEMEHLRFNCEAGLSKKPDSKTGAFKKTESTGQKLRVQCFGNFEVFKDDMPIHFERRGSKEILAYLINCKGASASRVEISMALWESDEEIEKRKAYFRTLILSLKNTLREYDAEDVLISYRDSFAVNTKKLDCDYYHFLNGDTLDRRNHFCGVYMNQYSWAEETIGQLRFISESDER